MKIRRSDIAVVLLTVMYMAIYTLAHGKGEAEEALEGAAQAILDPVIDLHDQAYREMIDLRIDNIQRDIDRLNSLYPHIYEILFHCLDKDKK